MKVKKSDCLLFGSNFGILEPMKIGREKESRMQRNLERSFELLDTVLKLKLAYLKKRFPEKSEGELIRKIHLDAIESKERAWNSLKT